MTFKDEPNNRVCLPVPGDSLQLDRTCGTVTFVTKVGERTNWSTKGDDKWLTSIRSIVGKYGLGESDEISLFSDLGSMFSYSHGLCGMVDVQVYSRQLLIAYLL